MDEIKSICDSAAGDTRQLIETLENGEMSNSEKIKVLEKHQSSQFSTTGKAVKKLTKILGEKDNTRPDNLIARKYLDKEYDEIVDQLKNRKLSDAEDKALINDIASLLQNDDDTDSFLKNETATQA